MKAARTILQKCFEAADTARAIWSKKQQLNFSCFTFTGLEIFFFFTWDFGGLFCFDLFVLFNLGEANQTAHSTDMSTGMEKSFRKIFNVPSN